MLAILDDYSVSRTGHLGLYIVINFRSMAGLSTLHNRRLQDIAILMYIEDITWWRKDMKFVKYCFGHKKIKLLSSSRCVMFFYYIDKKTSIK